MKFKIQVDGAEHEVEAGADGRLVLGGQAYEAKVSSPSDDRRVVQLGDKSYEVRIVENCADTGIFVLEVAGERVPITASEVAKGMAGGAAASAGTPSVVTQGAPAAATAVTADGSAGEAVPAKAPEDVKDGIWAPVPGKIVDVFVKVGDTVQEDDPVLVLEAMKMENELHAPKKGTVTAVMVKKGDQAERGQLLVALE